MKRRSVILWFGGFLILLIAVLLFRAPDEPQYGDRSLSEWLDDLQLSSVPYRMMGMRVVVPSATSAQVDAAHALRVIGTNAGPMLARMLCAVDPPWKSKLIQLGKRQKWLKLPLKTEWEKQQIALHALYELGPAAAPALAGVIQDQNAPEGARYHAVLLLKRVGPPGVPAVPALLPLVNHTNRQMRFAALEALGAIGPMVDWTASLTGASEVGSNSSANARESSAGQSEPLRAALRTLAASLSDTSGIVRMAGAKTLELWETDLARRSILVLRHGNSAARWGAATSLGFATERPDIAVPVLVECLGDTNGNIRAACAEALGRYGSHAKPALPGLTNLFDYPKASVRVAATNAVRQINLERGSGSVE